MGPDVLAAVDEDLDSRTPRARLVSAEATAYKEPEPARRDEEEGVFEIRDFTNASTFERLSHQISLATKHWASALKAASDAQDEVLQMKDGFELGGFKYDLVFQLVPMGETKKEDRLGLHAFPTRAHRLQRWFGVRHFLVISINNHNIDIDSARTLLGAAVLAAAQVSLHPQLSCFVPVEGGRKRVLGEAIQGDGGRRTIYCTDLHFAVQSSLEHLAGLADFFRRKAEITNAEPQDIMVGVRFTYSADFFDPWQPGDLENQEPDPIDSMKLHCLWPAFPLGAFQDDARSSELLPSEAPYWKLRLLRRSENAHGESAPPRTRQLQVLLGFRREAKQIRSAEQSMQSQVPKTAMASLQAAIQESLESILLPTAGEMLQMTDACMALPVVPAGAVSTALLGWTGARRQGRLTKLAELSSKMRCFKGAVMLWCSVLGRMRQQWDALEAPGRASASPPTHRDRTRGIRSEFFEGSMCLAQQKMELLQRSIEGARAAAVVPAQVVPDAAWKAPQLLLPALLTDDLLLQRDMAMASIVDPAERAELDGREMRADMAAFKAENHAAELADFLQWREQVEGLSLKPFPQTWLQETWNQTPAKLASEQQQKLFEPFREAEMALHYLESIEGPQMLLQIFRILLRDILEDLSQQMADAGNPTYLRVLRDRVVSTSSQAFRAAGACDEEVDVQATLEELADFPDEESLQSILAALEVLESSTRLASSIRAKLGDEFSELLEDLLTEGEADVTLPEQRTAIEVLFEQSKALELARRSRSTGAPRKRSAALGVFESLPLAKEFVLQLQPYGRGEASTEARSVDHTSRHCRRRMYAEVRENHMRLAVVRDLVFG